MKIGVVMGGISSEYEVSINTGKEIISNLDKKKYDVYPIEIKNKSEFIDKVKSMDFVILALHGKYGEDGTIQGTLDTMGIPYTGCGLASSAICMNKDISKKLLRYEGIQTPNWLIVNSINEINYGDIEKLGYPVVVKPNSGGSSIGAYIAHNWEEVLLKTEEALKLDDEVIIEQFIKGEEITCPILNDVLLPILSIKPKAEFFDYNSKYNEKQAEESVIELDKDVYKKVEKIALKCYETLKCSIYARVDIILKNDIPYVLEVNTLPGMTKNSLFPKSASSKGIAFSELLDLIIEYSLKERSN